MIIIQVLNYLLIIFLHIDIHIKNAFSHKYLFIEYPKILQLFSPYFEPYDLKGNPDIKIFL